MNIIKKVWDQYTQHIKDSIIPKEYSHQVVMNINILKGEKQGHALIPCQIYAMDHSIDLNPSLIRKKDKKVIKHFKTGKRIEYNMETHDVVLTKEEIDQGYELEELERCGKCGNKVVIAEVAQTRYRSCPDVWVTLGDVAKENLVIPVKFGVNRSDILTAYWLPPVCVTGLFLVTIDFLGIWTIPRVGDGALPFFTILIGGILGWVWFYYIPKGVYKNYKLIQWYNSIKHSLKVNPYKKNVEKVES